MSKMSCPRASRWGVKNMPYQSDVFTAGFYVISHQMWEQGSFVYRRIREEKEKAIREVRSEIADLSIAIAEKVMKEKISRDKEQQQIIDRLLDEVSFCKS